jgi:hypothetical protein
MTMWPEMPDCGVYLVWPCDGNGWIHPDDVAQVEKWIPSTRVFRRHSFDGEYYRLQYGDQDVRVMPTMWRRVDDEGFSVGDRIEVLSHFQENDPGLGVISEIRFDKSSNRILYTIESRELPLPRPFFATDFVPLTPRHPLRERDSETTL